MFSGRRGRSLSTVSRCCSLHLCDPACLHCLCVSLYVSWSKVSPLGGVWRDELPWGQTLTSFSGPPHGCHLLPEPVCQARDRLGRGQRGAEDRGGGVYGQWGQQMPAEATGDLPESILLHPPLLLSCNWWCPDSSSVTHITTVCHVTFLVGGCG